MTIHDSFHPAWANLKANAVRSFLSMLGIVIGTASVILVVSIVNGTREATLEQMKEGKENMLLLNVIFDDSTGRVGKITVDDIERVKTLPSVLTAFPVMLHGIEAKGTSLKAQLTLSGIDHHFLDLYKLKILSGRFFNEEETMGRPRICLISDTAAKKAFGFNFPIGLRLRLKEGSLVVVGMFKEEERLARMDRYADVLVPFNTAVQLFRMDSFQLVQIQAREGSLKQAELDVVDILRLDDPRRGGFSFVDMNQYIEETNEWSRRWLLQLAIVAGVSLFVGGIGLMNVMLTAVAERTQEIGVRKAVGADSKAILIQFLIESITLSGLGGFLGVAAGVLAAYSLNVFSNGRILVSVLPLSVAVSFLFSVVTGVIFGLFPASKASRLTPVEALRYE